MSTERTDKRQRAGLVLVIVLVSFLLPALVMAGAQSTATAPGWMQTNDSGFGDPANYAISTLDEFGGQLYAGTWNGNGAQLWRTPDGYNWSQITPGLSIANTSVYDLVPFAGHLYIGTDGGQGGEIWRGDGTNWQQVAAGGLGDINNYGFYALAIFNNALYAATANIPPVMGGTGNGVEVWRSGSGDPDSWQQVNTDGFGHGPTWPDLTMDVYQGHLYVGLSRVTSGGGSLAELWRTSNGVDWTRVFTDGLGYASNSHIAAMAEFRGELYIGLRNPTTSGQVWRSSNGLSWTPIFTDGLGDPARSRPYGLIVHDGRLVVVFSRSGGAEVWQTSDGLVWQQIASGGWGNSNNVMADYFDKAAAVFRSSLYIGTMNMTDGGEIWRRLHTIYLPLVLRNR